ncbi:AI-2E family transporter [Vulcanococcus limneticus]|uniref:AI-2E family transporter n=1 Tax=Vulcanococcus limneticus TaxID=2170428 RepID=UPI000B97D023|nr:AI-2E family transporter [Vulcanococcus limneticus]MCP9793140.1 AI-2E family transporter [Vulcanococcus limneticus MW73D5]MCP9895127.1 AI-2E family transporter [Vulcanococcus limneticus Candia 3F8]MCP9898538.1 AI-2E family transporter [Vulcanococcus limneticus Candia 3B3]
MNGRTLLGLLALVVVGLLAWELRWVLLVLFGAIVLAVALDVPVAWLRRVTPLNRTAALALVVVVLLLGGWKLGELLIPELLDQVQELIQLVPVLITRLGEMVGDVKLLQSLESRILSLATLDKLQPVGAQLLGFAGGAANGTIQLLLLVLLAILLALDPRSHQRLLIAATPSKYRPLVGELLRECREALGGWLAGMTISASAVFVLTWAGLALLQVPLALLSALVCGVLTFVPTIGPTVATLLPLAMAMLVSPGRVVQVLVLRLILQNGEAFLLTPILLNRTAHLLPTVALMAQLCLGALLGLPGVLLALPLVVVLQVLAEKVLVEQIMDRW